MADRKDSFSDDFDTVKRSDFVPVSIPAEDLMGHPFPTIRINAHGFNGGAEYMVPPKYAEHINLLVARVNKDAIRLLRPLADTESLQQQAGGGADGGRIKFEPAL